MLTGPTRWVRFCESGHPSVMIHLLRLEIPSGRPVCFLYLWHFTTPMDGPVHVPVGHSHCGIRDTLAKDIITLT